MENLTYYILRLLGKFRRVYFMALPEQEKDYEKSRRYYIAADTASQTILSLVTGSFLVSLLLAVGFSDAMSGTLSSIASLASLFQLLAMQRVEGLKKRKLFVCTVTFLKIFFALMFLVPLLPVSPSLARILVVFCFFLAQICNQVAIPAASDWIALLVPASIRGRYFAKKDAVAIFSVIVTMLLAGIFLDRMAGPKQNLGFLILGGCVFLLVMLNFWAHSCMKEPRNALLDERGNEVHGRLAKRYRALAGETEHRQKEHFFAEIKEAFGSQGFRKAFFTILLWNTILYGACPFHYSYLLKELGLSFTFLMTVNFVTNILRVILTPYFGKLGDAFGMAFVCKYFMVGHLLCLLIYMLTVPSNARIMTVLAYFFWGMGSGFTTTGLLGIQLELVREEKRTIQLSIITSLCGLYGFFVSLAAGWFLDLLQSCGLTLGGHPIYAQQVLNGIGAVGLIVYLKCRVQKGAGKKV